MRTGILQGLFLAIGILILVLAAVLIMVDDTPKEENTGVNDATGAMQSYEVHDGNSNIRYAYVRTSKRYDDKYFEYLEHIKESEEKTFMRGKVFLKEK